MCAHLVNDPFILSKILDDTEKVGALKDNARNRIIDNLRKCFDISYPFLSKGYFDYLPITAFEIGTDNLPIIGIECSGYDNPIPLCRSQRH